MAYDIVVNYIHKKTGRELHFKLYSVVSGIYQAKIWAVREYILHAYNDPKSEYYMQDVYIEIFDKEEFGHRYIFSAIEFLNNEQGRKYNMIIHRYMEEHNAECLAQLNRDKLYELAGKVEKQMYDDYIDLFQQPQEHDGEENNTNREVEYTPEIENIMEDTVHEHMDKNI